ncbi:CAP domain-containing protein, partial [Patescibacteria group bacterium]|nr:CAP domain-containing protein [Patescibacteria group bacterium]
RLRGRIILRVQEHGEAYYIHPKDLSLNYLQNGAEAYRIMRELSLGITNADLSGVPSSEFVPLESSPTSSSSSSSSTSSLSAFSIFQKGDLPSNMDLVAANEYWLDQVNELRAAKGLRQLVLDARWVDTATEWAGYMGENDLLTHTRADGKSMHQWIDTKGLDFTKRYSADGWVTNYFTENISWSYADNSQAGLEGALDDALGFFISETPDGAHYRTVYHEDWNSVGVGFYFREISENRYKVYMAFHYGSLEL